MIQVKPSCLLLWLSFSPGKFFLYLGGVVLLDFFWYVIHSCYRVFLAFNVFLFNSALERVEVCLLFVCVVLVFLDV